MKTVKYLLPFAVFLYGDNTNYVDIRFLNVFLCEFIRDFLSVCQIWKKYKADKKYIQEENYERVISYKNCGGYTAPCKRG